MSKFTFGPVVSRRFGVSLGIDLSPDVKQCNFDCLYCELEPKKAINKQETIEKTKNIISEVKAKLISNIDVLTVTANGEPTLYPKLNKLTNKLLKIKGQTKLLILSNGSTICDKKIKKILYKYDIVKLSLDAVSDSVFKKIDRSTNNISISKIIKHMVKFRKSFKNELVFEILFVDGVNDSDDEVKLLSKAINAISPDRLDIGTIDRPPAFNVKPVSNSRLLEIKNMFVGVKSNLIYSKTDTIQKLYYSESDIINTISKRALTQNDVDILFDEQTLKIFSNLLKTKKIVEKIICGVVFFVLA
jgi:wyosine [tRNA(Phe)-imidazoG37] synthetase (radical SAM superfamily)